MLLVLNGELKKLINKNEVVIAQTFRIKFRLSNVKHT